MRGATIPSRSAGGERDDTRENRLPYARDLSRVSLEAVLFLCDRIARCHGLPNQSHSRAMATLEPTTSRAGDFSEKEFYLAEFRGRSVALVLADDAAAHSERVRSVVADFKRNGTRCLLIASERAALEPICGPALVDAADPRWVGALWHALRSSACAGLVALEGDLSACARDAALRLRLAKLVWIDHAGGLKREGGDRLSYVDQAALSQLLGESGERQGLLREIETMVQGGLPSAAICTPDGLDDELFTYAGSGTFFTRDRYIEVRRLGLDDFDAGHDLVRRGVDEGYLVARDDQELEEVLTNAFGVFVEGRYLAGIGALIPHVGSGAGELGSLYTLTRFAGGGVGGHLVNYALEIAAERGFTYVYACTTQAHVVRFFQSYGFDEVEPESIPAEKWANYPAERRGEVTCLRRDLT